ncbi:MAG: PhzF family phenazine biosynthesis protein [Burkholderiales bacterium]
MRKPKFYFTDVFTASRYGGNPLATFVDCEGLSDEDMQSIAREIHFSETTFITSREPREGAWQVRIFTPNSEIDFAGHPTLGTAWVIHEKLLAAAPEEIVLSLRVGRIPVRFSRVQGRQALWMKQMPPRFGSTLDAGEVARMLGLSIDDIDPRWPVAEVSTGFPTVIVPLRSANALARAKIDRERYFALVSEAWAKNVLVFAEGGHEPGQSLRVRVFAEYYGVPEDPATGSGNGCLAAYLVEHGVLGGREVDIAVGQGYEMGRPSTLGLRARKTAGGTEVHVGGGVVGVAEGVWER